MEIIKVCNQSDLDRVPDDFKGIIQICGGDQLNRIMVNRKWGNSSEYGDVEAFVKGIRGVDQYASWCT